MTLMNFTTHLFVTISIMIPINLIILVYYTTNCIFNDSQAKILKDWTLLTYLYNSMKLGFL